MNPQRAKYNDIWDPAPVLRYLSAFEPNQDLSLEKLTKKLCTLLVLITAQRLQTLTKIKMTNIKILNDIIKIYVPDKLKTSKLEKEQPLLLIPFFHKQPKLCVASLLQTYINKTNSIRSKSEETLILTYKKPHNAASSQTISRWVKQTLEESGIDTTYFFGYSAKHASVSAARRKGLSIETIRQTAGWSKNSNVFAKFYNRPLREDCNFADTILSTVSQ